MKPNAPDVCRCLCSAIFSGILIFVCLPLLHGCSHGSAAGRTFNKLSGKFITSVTRLNKKIMVAPLMNHTPFAPPQISTVFDQNLNLRLRDSCPSLLYFDEKDPHTTRVLARTPKLPSGRVDNLSLAQAGRRLGLNAIVLISLSNIYRDEKSTGAWLFVSVERSITVIIHVEMYDTETGTKIMDDYFSRKTEVKKAVYDRMGDDLAAPPTEIIRNAVIFLAREAAEEICYQMDELPFKAYLESIDGHTVTVRAGKRAGIRKGTVLSVFNTSEVMNGQGGHRFYIPGRETGVIQISDVQADRSEGAIVSGRVDGLDVCLKPRDE